MKNKAEKNKVKIADRRAEGENIMKNLTDKQLRDELSKKRK